MVLTYTAHATHSALAATVALSGGRSWWNRPMVWASLAAICYGGWLAARRGQRRAEREAAENADYPAEVPEHPAVTARTAENTAVDEAMNRLGRDWHPEEPGP